jgi:transposase-like protein
MQKSFHLDEADVILVVGALTAYQAELAVTVNRSTDDMELETANVDLAHVERLLTVFKA